MNVLPAAGGVYSIAKGVAFMPHANPNPNREIDLPAEQPGSEEGLYVTDLADGDVVDIETQHRHYTLVKRADAHMDISGHPTFCPQPVNVEVEGSVEGRSALLPNPGFIGLGMYLLFKHPHFNLVTTSRIREIHTRGPSSSKATSAV
jgi:hypothetical protein